MKNIIVKKSEFEAASREFRESLDDLYGLGFMDTLDMKMMIQILHDMADRGKIFKVGETSLHELFDALNNE